MKPALHLLWQLKRTFLRVTGWKTRGVKVMLLNPAGELLLIRNSYGRSHLHVLPGGGIHRGETPEAAAAREVREEVAVACERLTLRSVHRNHAEGKRDTIYFFTGFTAGTPRPNSFEIEEAGFWPLDALPATVSAATLRRVAEYRGEQPVAVDW
jgi:ADP-ribose pyrophosphatase YjhB (NUDIX family)